MAKKDVRFVKTLMENGWSGNTEIWVDRETGVNYLFHSNGNAAGLTPLLNPDGKPVITPVSEDEE